MHLGKCYSFRKKNFFLYIKLLKINVCIAQNRFYWNVNISVALSEGGEGDNRKSSHQVCIGCAKMKNIFFLFLYLIYKQKIIFIIYRKNV